MKGIKQRLDTKPVARREDRAVYAVPQHNRKLSPQPLQAVSTEVLVKMQGNFTVRAGAQAMTGLLQLFLNWFVAVEFAVYDDPERFIFISDGLISRGQVDNAQAGVSKAHAPIGGDPV